MEELLVGIDATAEYVAKNPAESKETYEARRAELQELATPVVEQLRQVYADIEAAKEKKEAGGEPPAEPGDEEEELPDEDSSHDPDDL